MSQAREESDTPARQQDEFGNPLSQPSTTAMYGGPSTEGGKIVGLLTGDAEAFKSGYYGGQHQAENRDGGLHPEEGSDPTQRRGTTTGEYGKDGVGFIDRAKEKLDELGGFKDNPGHVATTGEPMEVTAKPCDRSHLKTGLHEIYEHKK